jgi:hypothetical protein
MKITKTLIKLFEDDQKYHGTKIALSNILWLLATDILTDIGVKRTHTTYFREKGKQGK